MRIYLASPFFNDAENAVVTRAETILRGRGMEVYSPREHEIRDETVGSRAWSEKIFAMDVQALQEADAVVMLYHGNYSDSGTAWECGYAFGIGKPVIALQLGTVSNLMVHESALANISLEELAEYDFTEMKKIVYRGAMT